MNTKSTPIPRTVFGLIEFAPILVFSYLGSAASTSLRTRFLISGSLALLVLVAQRVIKWPMNSLALSANIFLLLEGAAFITLHCARRARVAFCRRKRALCRDVGGRGSSHLCVSAGLLGPCRWTGICCEARLTLFVSGHGGRAWYVHRVSRPARAVSRLTLCGAAGVAESVA